jgi:hypothetical protein
MFLPSTKEALINWAVRTHKECMSSQKERMNYYATWRAYLMAGANDITNPSVLNKCGPHVDRLHTFLFSPLETRFLVDFGQKAPPSWQRRELDISRLLTKEFAQSDVDMAFGDAVFWSLPYGSAFVKLGIKTALESLPQAADDSWLRSLFGRSRRRPSAAGKGFVGDKQRQVYAGFDPYVVMPSQMGVWREDVNGLDRQEVICHVTYLSKKELFRRLRYHPERNEIMQRVQAAAIERSEEDESEFIHQVIIGGINPVQPQSGATGQATRGQVDVSMASPSPSVSPDVARDLVKFVELWVLDDEREDYTTIQYVEPDILIEGGDIRRNLFVPGHHPFTMVQPNDQQGYFWGRSEFSDLFRLQDAITDRLTDIIKIGRLQAHPPYALIGFKGISEETRRAFRTMDGLISEDMPNAKIEKLTPDLPQDAYQQLDNLIRYFDEIAGFSPIMQGQGEAGVRAGMHASNLQRTASARIRDRALKVERQCAELGDLCLEVLQAKDPTAYGKENEEYLLAQLPEDRTVKVDSHTSSPAFVEDQRQLAFALARTGAVTPEGLILLTNPPLMDQLLIMLQEKQQREAEFIRQHPEVLTKGKVGRPRK